MKQSILVISWLKKAQKNKSEIRKIIFPILRISDLRIVIDHDLGRSLILLFKRFGKRAVRKTKGSEKRYQKIVLPIPYRW